MSDEKELKVVFSGGYVEAEIVKGVLEEAGIEVYTGHEEMGIMFPMAEAPAGVGEIDVLVPADDEARARKAIEEAQQAGDEDTATDVGP